jgi:hypothetical protein
LRKKNPILLLDDLSSSQPGTLNRIGSDRVNLDATSLADLVAIVRTWVFKQDELSSRWRLQVALPEMVRCAINSQFAIDDLEACPGKAVWHDVSGMRSCKFERS